MSEKAFFQCMECGYEFRDVDKAERAQRHGCPGCGGTDIDLAVYPHTNALLHMK